MKHRFYLLLLWFISWSAQAQTLSVSGTVKDKSGEALPGVSVTRKGQNQGTVTNAEGQFSLSNVQATDRLIFSFVGYQTQEILVGKQTSFQIQMLEDAQVLEEVVVIGYGSQKVTSISGAISSVNAKTIEKLRPVRAEEALQGQAAGVNVIANGSPGSTPTVLIRGIPSYTGTDPLVVIDGVPQTLRDLNALNTNDIESINVLKDAATTAIYGVAGGNGVIVVKTKSGGRGGKTSFSFDSFTGIQQAQRMIPVLNATEYAAILNEASVASGGNLIFPSLAGLGEGTNWQKEVFTNAPITSNNLSISGGNATSSFFISGGYLTQQGIVGGGDKSYFNRTNFTANFTNSMTNRLKLLFNTSYAGIRNSNLSENNIGSVLSNALNFDPTVPVRDANGNFGISRTITQEIINPVAQINDTYNTGSTHKLFGKVEFQYDVAKNFKVTSRLGYIYADVYGKNFSPFTFYGLGHNRTNANPDLTPIVSVSPTGEITSTRNRVSESNTNFLTLNYELFANYDFKIGQNHSFETVFGTAVSRNTGENITANAEDIPFNSWEYADVSAAMGDPESQTSGSFQYVKRNLSYFARMNYEFKNKYLFSFTGRVDGSTSFGANNKFGFFPSASAGWVVSNESFFASQWVDYLKIRGSIGAVGNDNISPQFARISTFPKYTFDGNIISGSTLFSIPNESVTWENQLQMNIGFDTRIFNRKVSITADYFVKTVDDLLFNPTLSLYLGTPVYPAANIGRTSTKGLDLSIGYNTTLGKEFAFNTNVNFTTATNLVERINNGDKFIWGSGYGIPFTNLTRFEQGFSPGYFFGYKTDGLFQNQSEIEAHALQPGAQPGDIRYVDINQDGIINDLDRTQIGDPFPDFTLGWNVGFTYKNVDFSAFTYASVGGDIFRAYERNLNFTNRFAKSLTRWTGEGTSQDEPRATFIDSNNNRRPSDRYVEDGTFVRIKNIQLGYTLPLSNKSMNLRVYAQVKNAFTFTRYSGFDPEISSGVLDTGVDRGNYPQPRTWMGGLQFNF